jgi:hypothetical protein
MCTVPRPYPREFREDVGMVLERPDDELQARASALAQRMALLPSN